MGIQRPGRCAATAHLNALPTAPPWPRQTAAATATPHAGARVAKPWSSSCAKTVATVTEPAAFPAAKTTVSATAEHAAAPAVTSPSGIVACTRARPTVQHAKLAPTRFSNSVMTLATAHATIPA